MDSNSTTCDKVSEALTMLKMELKSIREQDVDLMKQLLKINDTIKGLSPKKTCSLKNHNGSVKSSRRQSYLNYYFNKRRGSYESSNGSLSSIEEFENSMEDCSANESSDMSGSEENILCHKFLPMTSDISSFQRATSDEHLFISNVKVWKYKQSRSFEELQHIDIPRRTS